jgi:N-hydroxyarylamine O-acetyltransferase
MTTTSGIDLDAYFARIGYEGSRRRELETLAAIHERHAQTIPFENIDVLLGVGVRLDLSSVEQKLVHARRGGYCFEHNTLLAAVLRAIGFAVTPMLARVRWQVPPENRTPQTHMILRVEVDGRPWLADAGFGGIGLTAPLALDTFEIQITTLEPRRLVARGREILQQVRLGETWTDVWTSSLDEAFPIDFEVGNWFTSMHPGSHFRHNLLVARPNGRRRVSLFNREFVIREIDGSAAKRQLGTPEELRRVLAEQFGLNLPAGVELKCPGIVWG